MITGAKSLVTGYRLLFICCNFLLILLLSACQPPSGAGPVAGPRPEAEPEVPAEAPPDRSADPDADVERRPAITSAALTAARPAKTDLTAALRGDLASLLEAIDRSLYWFEHPSTAEYFPIGGISHEHAEASVFAFRSILEESTGTDATLDRLEAEFDFYASTGSDGRGTVLFTGYYSPVFSASRTESAKYRYPLYRTPEDLLIDSATGDVLGRRVRGRIVPYPTRAEIETSEMLAGAELAWLRDRFDAYLIHVQGSAALVLPNGSTMHVGYDGNNGHEYSSPALALVADGKLPQDELSLEEVRAHFARHPEDLDPYLRRNERFIFFREAGDEHWPTGSLGVKVTPMRSIATDKELFPPAGVVLAVTHVQAEGGGSRRFTQFVLDQDSGAAIRTPGRADLYFGVGRDAETLAGGQYAEGRLYYLFLKADRVEMWRRRMR